MAATRLTSRALVCLTPREGDEDAHDFLQGLVTNDVSGELPVYAALLSAQGKTMFDFIVWNDGDALLLDCEAIVADDLIKRLSLYRLRRKIDIVRDTTLGVFWSADKDVSGAVPGTEPGSLMIPANHLSPDPRHSALGTRWLAPIDSMKCQEGDAAYLHHRLSLGVPEGQTELGDILWLETNAVELNGVSFEKGCYVGQENTARMNWRQKVNRRLVVVPLDASDEKRRKIAYPEWGLAVDHLRVTDLDPSALPDWQRAGIEG